MTPDLSVQVAGVRLKNPIICASGEPTSTFAGIRAAIDAGAGAVIAKSTNESAAAKRQLASARYALLNSAWREVPWAGADADPASTSVFCRSGLAPEDFETWVAGLVELDRYAQTKQSIVIGSLIVSDADVAATLASAMQAAGLRMLEVNFSAPHGEEAAPGAIRLEREPDRIADLTRRIRQHIQIPLLIKLSGQTDDVLGEVGAAYEGGADAVVLMGRHMGFLPDVTRRRPLLGTFAAIGGGWALPLTLRWVAKARARFGPSASLIATNGVRSGLDVARSLLAGASAVEVCSLVMQRGYGALGHLADEMSAYLSEQGIARASDIIGEAADGVQTYQQAAPPAENEVTWRSFVPADEPGT
ncbi:MAG TPA: hypothetical protein VFU63_06105 [Ktedonobacterales bacterium]|nr:hypothetical protein [Ktedonobacterales bacterium]